MATQKKTKNNLPSCCKLLNYKFLSLVNKNEFCSVKIPPQRSNISPSVAFLKIALLLFSIKKIRKREWNLQQLPCVTIPTSENTLLSGSRRTLQFLSHLSLQALWFSMSLIYSFCLPDKGYSHLMPLPKFLSVETICTPKDHSSYSFSDLHPWKQTLPLNKTRWYLEAQCLPEF